MMWDFICKKFNTIIFGLLFGKKNYYLTELFLRLLCFVIKIPSKHSYKIWSGSSVCLAVCHSKFWMLFRIGQKFWKELEQRFSAIYDGNCKRNSQGRNGKQAEGAQTILLPFAYCNAYEKTDDEVVKVTWKIPRVNHTLK